MGRRRSSRSGKTAERFSRAPGAKWLLARPRESSKGCQRGICRPFIEGGRQWRAGEVTEVSPGQDQAVGKGFRLGQVVLCFVMVELCARAE